MISSDIKLKLIQRIISLSYFLQDTILGFGDYWSKYQLARCCLTFGRPRIAAQLLVGAEDLVNYWIM
jgi:hypothetical protein